MQTSIIWSNYAKQKALTVFQLQLRATNFQFTLNLHVLFTINHEIKTLTAYVHLGLSYIQNVPFSSWRKHKDGCATASLQYQWYVDQQNPTLSEYVLKAHQRLWLRDEGSVSCLGGWASGMASAEPPDPRYTPLVRGSGCLGAKPPPLKLKTF